MTDLHNLAAQLAELRTKLLEKERRFRRIARWTKPLLWLGAGVLLITLILPFLLPFTLPLLIGAAAVLAIRWALYVFVFKDPERAYRQHWDERVYPALAQRTDLGLQLENLKNIQTEELNEIRLFFLRADRTDMRGCASALDARIRMAYVVMVREKVTLGTVLKDIGEDILTDLIHDQGDWIEDSRSKDVPFFRGLLAEVRDLDLGRWMVVPATHLPLYRKSSHYPARLRLPMSSEDDLAILTGLEGHGPDPVTLDLIRKNQPAIVLSTGKSLWLAMPRKRSLFGAYLHEPDSTEVEHLEQFVRDMAWIEKWSAMTGA